MKYYVLSVTINSGGSENRVLTPYENEDTALRKFFEIFQGIGGGPRKIQALLLDEDLYTIKAERWAKVEEEGE